MVVSCDTMWFCCCDNKIYVFKKQLTACSKQFFTNTRLGDVFVVICQFSCNNVGFECCSGFNFFNVQSIIFS